MAGANPAFPKCPKHFCFVCHKNVTLEMSSVRYCPLCPGTFDDDSQLRCHLKAAHYSLRPPRSVSHKPESYNCFFHNALCTRFLCSEVEYAEALLVCCYHTGRSRVYYIDGAETQFYYRFDGHNFIPFTVSLSPFEGALWGYSTKALYGSI